MGCPKYIPQGRISKGKSNKNDNNPSQSLGTLPHIAAERIEESANSGRVDWFVKVRV